MNNNELDLLVIGAGATGATIAYEATKRGLKVALLDSGDIGGGTSSRSTKLLHGGVRYLELAFKTFDIAQLQLVQEALVERGYWLKKVPFLSRKLELALPSKNLLELAYYRIGLGFYDILSGRENIGSSRILSIKELTRSLPNLRKSITGGIAYSDGQFDDARLNLLLALTAERGGAILRTRCKVITLIKSNKEKVCGAISKDLSGKLYEWKAKVVINATGNQADFIRQDAGNHISPRMLTSRGVHIVLKENLCKEGMGLLIPETSDGRVIFALPFYGYTQVGTTDTPCNIEHANVPTKEEEKYLIHHVMEWFPNIGSPTIKSSWAGGRPLLKPSKENLSSSKVIREHDIEILPSGLISAMGGKWTTCRSIALDTLKAVEKVLNKKLRPPTELPIIGSCSSNYNIKELLAKQRLLLSEYIPDSPYKEKQLSHLQSNYGLEALKLIEQSDEKERVVLSEIIPICEAEIIHAIKYEHAKTVTDILARRCRLAMVDFNEASNLLPIVKKHLNGLSFSESELDLAK